MSTAITIIKERQVGRSFKVDETLPSGSIIHWSQREAGNPARVQVTCGKCGKKRFTTIQGGKNKQKWTGFCHKCGCAQTRFTEDERLPSGSIIHWSERIPTEKSIWVTCGKCGNKRRLTHTARCNDWSGLCQSCGGKKYHEEETHASGTIIHWGERDVENPRKRIAITCHECKQKSFAWLHTIKYPNWSGLCAECRQRRGHPRKYLHDEKLSSGSIIHWAERDPDNPDKRVMITCGYCGEKRLTSRKSGVTLHRQSNWTGYCRKHFFNLAPVRTLLIEQAQREHEGNVEQQNGNGEKHRRGPKKGYNAKVTEDKIRAAFQTLGRYAPQENLAEEIGVEVRTLRRWQQIRNLTYPQLRQQFAGTGQGY